MTTPVDFIDPVELTEFSRIAASEFDAQSQTLASILPYRGIGDIRYAYSRGMDALVDVAEFRSFDAESQIARRPGASRVTGELQPISRKIPLSEYAQLRIRNASNDEIATGIYSDASRLSREVAARFELARGELLQTGNIVLNENGVVSTYASGRNASLTETGPIGADWDDPGSDPIADVIADADLVQSVGGIRPDTMIVSSKIMVDLQKHAKVIGALTANAPAYGTRGMVEDAFLGIAGVRIRVVDSIYPLTTPAIDEEYIVLYNAGVSTGETLHGVTVESTDPKYANLSVQPGLVAGSWTVHDPATLWTHAVAIGLPILVNPDTTMGRKVYT